MLSFALFMLGAIVVIAGLAWVATLLGAASTIVTYAAAILFVVAIIGAAAQKRQAEPPAA